MKKHALFYLITLGFFSSQAQSDNIRLNQIGFYPSGEKMAIVLDSSSRYQPFYVISTELEGDTVFRGRLSAPTEWEYSEEIVRKADFSTLRKKGEFVLSIPGKGSSYTFTIQDKVMAPVAKATLRAFYYHRASMELLPQHAGKWSRKMGHPDDQVFVHNSAQSVTRKTGTVIRSTKGWYDAGDYNKYIVNSGITMYTLLSLLEDFPFYTDTLSLNIPESHNRLPDVLDEILWNLRWMLTMQDPGDGGVYHKLTNPNFDATVMPFLATKTRYVVKKSTNATLDFAAVMAQAARVVRKYRKQLPGLADSCLKASVKAYDWSLKNPAVAYEQSELSDPTINTGAYGDYNFRDEWLWASVELFITTGKLEYYERADVVGYLNIDFSLPVWQNVATLGLYSLVKHGSQFKEDKKYEDVEIEPIKKKILNYVYHLKFQKGESAYSVPMGANASDFSWGSNSVCANQGIALVQAFLLTEDKSYLEAANANLDYLLGRNATMYSFITGVGKKYARNPHHRLSEADGIEEPVPGFIVGGPNPGQEDKGVCSGKPYPSRLPALSYLDQKCSYASNEIAINWQSAIAYLTTAVEAIRAGDYEPVD